MPDRQTSAVIPQYVKIANDLREKIRDGTYGPGALLPSRNELTAMYGVSAITARDALSMISHEGYAKAVRGRGHIVRRKRSRITLPARLYTGEPDPAVPLHPQKIDVYQEQPPDNIALPLEADADTPVWVRRAVYAADDRQPLQIHVSWIPAVRDADAGNALDSIDPHVPWPQTVQDLTGRTIAAVLQLTRARSANPFEARTFGLPEATKVLVIHATTYDARRRPIEHSRYSWPTDAVRISEYYSYPAAPSNG